MREDRVLQELITELDSLLSEKSRRISDGDTDYYKELHRLFATREKTLKDDSNPRLDEISAEQQRFYNDYGLSFNWSYLNNIEQGIFTGGDIFYNKRLTTGLKWDILGNGLLDNRSRAAELEVEKEIAEKQLMQSNAEDKYKVLYKKILYLFTKSKSAYINEYLDVVSVNLELLHRLHYKDLLSWQEVLRLSSLKAQLEHKLDTYRAVEKQLVEAEGIEILSKSTPEVTNLAVPDLDIELFLNSVRNFHEDIQLSDDKLDKLDYSFLSDISFSVSAQYNIYDNLYDRPENEAVGGREYFSTTFNISFPLPINMGSKKKLAEARKRRIVQDQKEKRRNISDEITDHFLEYQQQKQRYLELYETYLMREEEIKSQQALRKIGSPDFSIRKLSNAMIDRYGAVLDLIEAKQQLYLKLVNIDSYLPNEGIEQFISGSQIENYEPKAKRKADQLYIWSSSFAEINNQKLLHYLKREGFSHLFLSVGPDTSLYRKAKAFNQLASRQGITAEMLIGNNHLVNHENRANEFLQLANRAERLQFEGIHLDVEPHTFDDWDSNREMYLRSYVNMLEAVRASLEDTSLKLSISIPHFYDSIISDLVQYADTIVVMAYETTDIKDLLDRTEVERKILMDRLAIALRPTDFSNRRELNNFVREIVSQTKFQTFVLHDYDALKELEVK
ncbi:glycoside hydrolase family 18 protein [Aliifodinibius salicampi]|uniref:Glycoside hydrolase family 18 protein n=1 Tax=Fodinibius salicampi TaxID=1920655 RepID=A0ABT3PUD7_9BACT|nr:TolC family protein [Fodinibius salicampi]MCW9711468.1 glycoside hydrolase family 18 protein [Fodinibius salicampi]